MPSCLLFAFVLQGKARGANIFLRVPFIMKKRIITDMKSLPALDISEGVHAYPVVPKEEVKQCRIHFVEVQPGKEAYGYHWHETDEEAFFVISGCGMVRTPEGEWPVRAGQIVTFPAGEGGAHVMRNASDTEALVYLDFGTQNVPDICHLPDMGKLLLTSRSGVRLVDAE